MIIDMNSFLGRWGIRSKGIADVDDFLKTMEASGINLSLVTGTIALVTDTKEGNRYLMDIVAPYRKKLEPIICVNPLWGIDEAEQYFQEYDFKVVRLSPSLHNYSLLDDSLIEPFMGIFRKKKVLLYITSEITYLFCALANKIGYFPPVYPVSDIVKFAERYPDQKMVISGYTCELFQEVEKFLIPGLVKCDNLFLETSNIIVCGMIEKLCSAVPDKILLGTASGIIYPAGGINKILCSGISEEQKGKILYKNAEGLLKTI